MSILSKNRPEPDAPEAPPRPGGKSAQLSAPPRADLLPPEIGEGNKKKAARRGMRLLMFFVLVVVLAASAFAFYVEFQAGNAQRQAEEDASRLLIEKASYSDIRNILQGISEGEAAIQVGGSTDIDWATYLRQLQMLLPPDVTLTQVSVESSGTTATYAQSLVPLERARIATLTFTAETTVLPSIPSWINALSGLPGFADATPQSLTNEEGLYSAQITMHINPDAYSQRFVPVDETESAEGTEEVAQ